MDFNYILDKVNAAEILEKPFRHIEIFDLFSDEHFSKIIDSSDIKIDSAISDEKLFDNLFNSAYRIVKFPGCTESRHEYIRWHRSRKKSHKTNTACESFGVVLRLDKPRSIVISQLKDFFESSDFISCIARKFDIKSDYCEYDAGIQKYLDGYEISPHPDMRRKALTFMININPSPTSENDDYHTCYLQFKPEWNYVQEYWRGNTSIDRCWVPWEWCKTVKQQRENNSMVLFSPANDTLHGIKADYCHLHYQRTQVYGNLWYKEETVSAERLHRWEDLVVQPETSRKLLTHLKKGNFGKLLFSLKKYFRMGKKNTHGVRKIDY